MAWHSIGTQVQYYQVNGHRANPLTVTTRISQGSGLRPSLFLIYINDFPKCLRHIKPDMFADNSDIIVILKKTNSDIIVVLKNLKADLSNVSN